MQLVFISSGEVFLLMWSFLQRFWTSRTLSYRTWRDYNPTRFIMDVSRRQISLSRRVFNEQEFKRCYVPKQSTKKPKSVAKRLKKHFCTNISKLTCRGVLNSWFPIFSWLPQYQVKEDLLSDVAGGLTVAILHIPQGTWSYTLHNVFFLLFAPLLPLLDSVLRV